MERITRVLSRPQSLAPLPEELLDVIVSYAGQNVNYATLTSLCLVSRQFYRVAQPHLYSNIVVDTRNPEGRILIRCVRRITKLWHAPSISLLELLTQRSGLSQHVRTLRIVHDPFEHPQWIKRDENIIAYLEVLHNLEFLDASYKGDRPTDIDGSAPFLPFSIFADHDLLRNLRRIDFFMGHMELFRAARFSHLPLLETLNLQAAGLNGLLGSSTKSCAWTSPSLRHLSISGTSRGIWPKYQLEALCASCTTLESFQLLSYYKLPGFYIIQLVLIALQPALECSLKFLDLCGTFKDGEIAVRDTPHERTFKKLAKAMCLQELRLDWEASLWPVTYHNIHAGVEFVETRLELPTTLQVLHLRCSIYPVHAAVLTQYLRMLSEEIQTKQRRLKDITVEFVHIEYWPPPSTVFDTCFRQTLETSLADVTSAFMECDINFGFTLPDST